MTDRIELMRQMLKKCRDDFDANSATLTLGEALFAAGGYRSILGVIKHMGGWLHVYRSYAFDVAPEGFWQVAWPGGLRDTVEKSVGYVASVRAWVDAGLAEWDEALANSEDEDVDRPHRLHWGDSAPLFEIVTLVAQHVAYHTGELNLLLSIKRSEAWEYTEEVEENHISTFGHGVRPGWMSDAQARRYEEALRSAHDAGT